MVYNINCLNMNKYEWGENMANINNNAEMKRKKIFAAAVIALLIIFMVIVTFAVGYPLIRFIKEPDEFRSLLDRFGLFGDIIFLLIIVFQVVIAIIPGEPFEVFAGIAFGVIRGTTLCLIGALCGTAIVFLLVRKFGVMVFELFFSREKMNNLRFLRNTQKNKLLLFFIFLLPGTPKDLLTFFIGLTDIKLSEWLVISTVARIPSVITSVICGSTIENEEYGTAVIVFGVTVIISIIGLSIYNAIIKHKNKKTLAVNEDDGKNDKE